MHTPPMRHLIRLARPHTRQFRVNPALFDGGQPRAPHKTLMAPVPEPQDHRRSWFFTVYRFSNFAVIPFAVVYCVFFADFGEKEHVFSPARRWLDRQRTAFFSLSSEELELARTDSTNASGPASDSQQKPKQS